MLSTVVKHLALYKPCIIGSMPASPVCQMRLQAMDLSPYDLSCWWYVNKNTQHTMKMIRESSLEQLGLDNSLGKDLLCFIYLLVCWFWDT